MNKKWSKSNQMVQIKEFNETCINKCLKTKLPNMGTSQEPQTTFLVYLGIRNTGAKLHNPETT